MAAHRRTRIVGVAVAAVAVAVIATAFALGGSSSSSESSGGLSTASSSSGSGNAGAPSAGAGASTGLAPAAAAPPQAAASGSAPSDSAPSGSARSSSVQGGVESVADDVTATRVVKTGDLGLRVARGQVQATVSKLTTMATGLGGYVAKSSTDNELGEPTGEVTLRIPATRFETGVNDAERYGKVTSLSTNATDVTGRYVDLGARLSALKHTRTTYLTILGRATTIGTTLEVQQRVDDVQQQIEELQGQLKVLGNQSADGTLTVDVSQVGAPVKQVHRHHKANGIGAAWHRSITRFQRGFDAIVGALGPLLLVLLILGAFGGVALLGYRGIRRVNAKNAAPSV
jgi:Domain of unknown function (DUF4349)